ncbi:MAG: NUDIX hydrolase [bacterium]
MKNNQDLGLKLQSHFKTLFSGCFDAERVQVNYQPEHRTLPAPLNSKIETFWQNKIVATSKNSYIFNGDLCRFNNWQIQNNTLLLELGFTNYKELLFSNEFTEWLVTHHGQQSLSRALGVSAVVLSRDQQIVLIERSHSVGESPGKLDVVGGHIHPEEHAVSGTPGPFYAMKAEIAEELGLILTEDEKLLCLGLIETKHTRKPELIFQVKIGHSAAEIQSRASKRTSSEIAGFVTVANDRTAVSQFLQQNIDQLSPSAIGSLYLYNLSLK